eukprot:6019986-Pleurochrysis_carterae.AAC.1
MHAHQTRKDARSVGEQARVLRAHRWVRREGGTDWRRRQESRGSDDSQALWCVSFICARRFQAVILWRKFKLLQRGEQEGNYNAYLLEASNT